MVAGDCGGVSEHGTFRDGSVKEPERSTAVLARSGPSGVCRTIWNIPEKGRHCSVKSDSLIVLGAWESRAHGEAAKQMKTGFRETSPAVSYTHLTLPTILRV